MSTADGLVVDSAAGVGNTVAGERGGVCRMSEVPNCAGCGRPLQRGRDICIYCGRALSERERAETDAALDDESVRRQVEEADAVLEVQTPSFFGRRGRLIAKILLVLLALLALLFISWVSRWQPAIVALAAIFFALPIWQALRKL